MRGHHRISPRETSSGTSTHTHRQHGSPFHTHTHTRANTLTHTHTHIQSTQAHTCTCSTHGLYKTLGTSTGRSLKGQHHHHHHHHHQSGTNMEKHIWRILQAISGPGWLAGWLVPSAAGLSGGAAAGEFEMSDDVPDDDCCTCEGRAAGTSWRCIGN